MFMVWFLLLVAAIGLGMLLLSDNFKVKLQGFALSAGSLTIITIILYITQWSQTSAALY